MRKQRVKDAARVQKLSAENSELQAAIQRLEMDVSNYKFEAQVIRPPSRRRRQDPSPRAGALRGGPAHDKRCPVAPRQSPLAH